MECHGEDQLNRHNAKHLENLALDALPQSLFRFEGNLKSEKSILASSIKSRSTGASSNEPMASESTTS